MIRITRIMPQVSKRFFPKDREEKVYGTLFEAISQLKRREDINLFLNDLLTPTEKIMLAKRLAIAVLLVKGWDYGAIRDFLKVSNDPISKVAISLKLNKGYRKAIDKLVHTESVREFWREVGVLVDRLGVAGDTFADEGLLRHKLGFKKKTLI